MLGNHEFDDGIAGAVPFIKSLTTPVVCANINDAEEPDIQGTYTKSVVIERGGKKIGIIGVIYSRTNVIVWMKVKKYKISKKLFVVVDIQSR